MLSSEFQGSSSGAQVVVGKNSSARRVVDEVIHNAGILEPRAMAEHLFAGVEVRSSRETGPPAVELVPLIRSPLLCSVTSDSQLRRPFGRCSWSRFTRRRFSPALLR